MIEPETGTVSSVRPEGRLLLCCARTRIEPDAAQRITRALQGRIDWEYLIYETFYHGTAPLLFRNLNRTCPGAIPEAAFKELKDAVNYIACSNLYLTAELLKLLGLFRNVGIRALPLKGPVLAAAAYGDLSLRSFGDLDVLVSREDIMRAKDVLLQQGYEPSLQLSSAEEKLYLQTHHDYKFTRPGDTATVEIQWGVTQWSFAFPIDFDEIWQRRKQIVLAGTLVPTMSTEDLLLALCVHGAKHRWEHLKWICDIAELVTAIEPSVAWNSLIVRARALGGERMLLLGVFLAHDLLRADLPDQVLRTIHRESHIKSLAAQVRKRLFRERSQSDELRDERPFFYWHTRECLLDRLAIARRYFPEYFRRMVVPNYRDYTFVGLPGFLSLGYYLVRPVRLVKDYLSKSKRHARGLRE